VPHLDLASTDGRTIAVGETQTETQSHAVAILHQLTAKGLGAASVWAFELLSPLSAHDGSAGQQLGDLSPDRVCSGHSPLNSWKAA
jgi:hypothetical protein